MSPTVSAPAVSPTGSSLAASAASGSSPTGGSTTAAAFAAEPTAPSERSRRTSELLACAAETPNPAKRAALLSDVVVLNKGVAEAVARRYRGRGVPWEDLRQVAYEGLIHAVQRFDITTGNDLLAFAVPTIRGAVLRHFRDVAWVVRPPRRLQELQWAASREIAGRENATGRPPTRTEVAAALGVAPQEYDEAVVAMGGFRPASLDQPIGTSATRGDLVPGDDAATTAAEARVCVHAALRHLPPADRELLYLRYFEDLTQEQIGTALGISQVQVSRRLRSVLRRLRCQLDIELVPSVRGAVQRAWQPASGFSERTRGTTPCEGTRPEELSDATWRSRRQSPKRGAARPAAITAIA